MKNILLIGGSYGIGSSLSKILADNNNVIVASRTEPEFKHNNVKYLKFDAKTDSLNVNELPTTIDGFVYLPGSINLRPFKGLSLESFQEDLDITVAVSKGMPFHSSVALSKGAIEGLAKSLAAEFAPKIRVNVIAPSIVNTPLANRFLNNEIKVQKSSEKHPLNRIGNKDDISEMINFLLSEKSTWITGQIISVDGGLSTIIKN